LEEELELFEADRRQHVQELIVPALDRGAWVVLDRYYFSTAAYQGARGANPQEILRRNEAFATQPDLVLLLDCAPEVSLERVRARGDVANEFERLDALERVRDIFLSIQRPFIRRVDASVSPEAVYDACCAQIDEVLTMRR
jgi:dTMP kinase